MISLRTLGNGLLALLSPNRPTQPKRPRPARLALESLEGRCNPANVTATLNGSILVLTADQPKAVEAITVSPSFNGIHGAFTIADDNGATTINGQTQLSLGVGVTGISIDLKGGNDVINVQDGVQLSGLLRINGGDGANQITLSSGVRVGALAITTGATIAGQNTIQLLGNVQVAGNLTITTRSADSTITLAGPLHVGGNVSIQTGLGDDNVSFSDLFVNGSFNVNLGAGDNSLSSTGLSHIGGRFTFTGGAGEDNVSLGNGLSIGGSAILTTGSGDDSVAIGAGVSVGRNLDVNVGKGDNSVLVYGSNVGQGLRITGGTGADKVTLGDDWVGGLVTLNLGDGAKTVSIDDNPDYSSYGSTLLGGLTLTTGNGPDSIQIGGANPVTFGGAVTLTTGNETGITGDSIFIDDSTFLNSLTIQCGDGNDVIAFETRITTAQKTTQIAGLLKVLAGAGNDQLDMGVAGDSTRRLVLALVPYLDGGPGSNTLNTHNYSVAGVDNGILNTLNWE